MSFDLGMWVVSTDRPNLARLYCEKCGRSSRWVRKPTVSEQRAALPIPVYPEPPRGWEHGCPRCR